MEGHKPCNNKKRFLLSFCSPLGFQNIFRSQQRKLKQEQSWKVQTRLIKPDIVPSPPTQPSLGLLSYQRTQTVLGKLSVFPEWFSLPSHQSSLVGRGGEKEWRGLVTRRNPRREYLLKVRKFLRLKCMRSQVSENSEMSGNFYSHLIKQRR